MDVPVCIYVCILKSKHTSNGWKTRKPWGRTGVAHWGQLPFYFQLHNGEVLESSCAKSSSDQTMFPQQESGNSFQFPGCRCESCVWFQLSFLSTTWKEKLMRCFSLSHLISLIICTLSSQNTANHAFSSLPFELSTVLFPTTSPAACSSHPPFVWQTICFSAVS